MKKFLAFFPIAALLIIISGCSSRVSPEGALIEGRIRGFAPDDSITVLLMHYSGDAASDYLNDTLKNERFSFRLDSLPEGESRYLIQLIRSHDKNNADILCYGPDIYLQEGARVRICGEGRYLYTARIKSQVKDQKLRQRFLSKMSFDDWKGFQDHFLRQFTVLNEMRQSAGKPQSIRDSLRAVRNEDMAIMDSISNRLTMQKISLLETEPIGDFALNELETLAADVADGDDTHRDAVLRILDRLTEEQKESPLGKSIMNYLQIIAQVSVGESVPDYEYLDQEGAAHILTEFSGRWILVDFWSLGCLPCIIAVPELAELAGDASFEDLSVVSINVDGEEGWKEASAVHGITWNNWRDPAQQAGSIRAYDQGGLPVFVLVDPDGTITEIHLGYHKGLLHEIVSRHIGPS